MSIKRISPSDFPPLLHEISEPPKQLYIEGNLPNYSHKFLSVVGARKYSSYGKEVCEKLILGLSSQPITIVSGLALGIDSIAHKAALAAGLKNVAVPGSGLNQSVLYPSLNQPLAKKILENGGTLLSEFDPDFRATTWSFPKRNRIMAGMSHATLVIEANQKSGTLITARLATEYNRDVLTVPGNIFSSLSDGPHMLIRLGATPITSSENILEALHIDSITSTELEMELSRNEETVLNLLSSPISREALYETCTLSESDINATLTILEIKGLISESLGEIHSNITN